MDKTTRFKLKIMKSLQDDETRQLQNEVLGHLIELDTPDEIIQPVAIQAPERAVSDISLNAPIVAQVAQIEAPIVAAQEVAPNTEVPTPSTELKSEPSVEPVKL